MAAPPPVPIILWMSSPQIRPLRENAGLAFVGELPWRSGALQPEQARTLWTTVTANGRPYSEVLRCFLGVGRSSMVEHWQIDFPPHFTEQEVGIYPDPAALLRSRESVSPLLPWWQNPYANAELRSGIARLERFLASPLAWPAPAWNWVESTWLPDQTLLAVLRDDDFTAGVLRSRFFSYWWTALGTPHANALVAESFAFPWAPQTPLSALTGLQQDLRFAIGRAARADDQAEIDRQVATAYGWPTELEPDEVVQRLLALNQRRK